MNLRSSKYFVCNLWYDCRVGDIIWSGLQLFESEGRKSYFQSYSLTKIKDLGLLIMEKSKKNQFKVFAERYILILYWKLYLYWILC